MSCALLQYELQNLMNFVTFIFGTVLHGKNLDKIIFRIIYGEKLDEIITFLR